MYFILASLCVLTACVIVCVCHAELKGYLLNLFTSPLFHDLPKVYEGVKLKDVNIDSACYWFCMPIMRTLKSRP